MYSEGSDNLKQYLSNKNVQNNIDKEGNNVYNKQNPANENVDASATPLNKAPQPQPNSQNNIFQSESDYHKMIEQERLKFKQQHAPAASSSAASTSKSIIEEGSSSSEQQKAKQLSFLEQMAINTELLKQKTQEAHVERLGFWQRLAETHRQAKILGKELAEKNRLEKMQAAGVEPSLLNTTVSEKAYNEKLATYSLNEYERVQQRVLSTIEKNPFLYTCVFSGLLSMLLLTSIVVKVLKPSLMKSLEEEMKERAKTRELTLKEKAQLNEPPNAVQFSMFTFGAGVIFGAVQYLWYVNLLPRWAFVIPRFGAYDVAVGKLILTELSAISFLVSPSSNQNQTFGQMFKPVVKDYFQNLGIVNAAASLYVFRFVPIYLQPIVFSALAIFRSLVYIPDLQKAIENSEKEKKVSVINGNGGQELEQSEEEEQTSLFVPTQGEQQPSTREIENYDLPKIPGKQKVNEDNYDFPKTPEDLNLTF